MSGNSPIDARQCPFCSGHYAMIPGRVMHDNPTCKRFKLGGKFFLASVACAESGSALPPIPQPRNRKQRRAEAARARKASA